MDLALDDDGGDEPRFVSGASHSVFFEDFDSYCDAKSFTLSGGWEMDGPVSQLTAPVNSGEDGGRAAEFMWHVGDGWLILSKDLSTRPRGRVAYMSWDYRAPNFSYGGRQTAQLEKKHMIINLGQNTRITVEMHGYAGEEALVVAMLQTVGPYLFENPTKTPWGDQHATIQHLTDGAWHHFTVKRTAESRNGALDGAIELWLDGQKLFNLHSIGTSTDDFMNLAVAGTINGGSSTEQHEYYDNIRIWY